ncbi:hypothetical protein M23134_00612 [Microscilla marina ATCC 23134]|uniref:Uncharacterized protein n=2 Tax=Microscilla marina TaxID=1027 RepID=A1ZY94_MICM2|nr:hypothetical protein M23134_00612 [Microscilla marina ATCC 23134]
MFYSARITLSTVRLSAEFLEIFGTYYKKSYQSFALNEVERVCLKTEKVLTNRGRSSAYNYYIEVFTTDGQSAKVMYKPSKQSEAALVNQLKKQGVEVQVVKVN